MARGFVKLVILGSLFTSAVLGPVNKRAVPNIHHDSKANKSEEQNVTTLQPMCPVGQLRQRHGNLSICCRPTVCTHGFEIETCNVAGGQDKCVACKKGEIQLNNISSFEMDEAKCFPDPYLNARDGFCPIEDTQKSNHQPDNCAMYCECKTDACYVGNPCGCSQVSRCSINEQLNKHTKKCEPCPPHSYKHSIGCWRCTYNLTAFSQGMSIKAHLQENEQTTPPIVERTTSVSKSTPTQTSIVPGNPVDEQPDKKIPLSLREILFIVFASVLTCVITIVLVRYCQRSPFFVQISQKICPNVSGSSPLSESIGLDTREHNLIVDTRPELQPLVVTDLDLMTQQSQGNKELEPQISVDSGIGSPSLNGDAFDPNLIRDITVNTPRHSIAESAALAPIVECDGNEAENGFRDVSDVDSNEASGNISSIFRPWSNNQSLMTDVEIEIENEEVDTKLLGVMGVKHRTANGESFNMEEKQDEFIEERKETYHNLSNEMLTNVESSSISQSSVEHETLLKEMIENDGSSYSEVSFTNTDDISDNRNEMCDKSVDIQKSLRADTEKKTPIIAVVRPFRQEDEVIENSWSMTSSIASYPPIHLEPNRMCEFSDISDIYSPSFDSVEGQPNSGMRGEFVSRAGPEGVSRSLTSGHETTLKQPFMSENTGVKCVYEGEMYPEVRGDLSPGRRRDMSHKRREEMSPGVRGEISPRVHGQTLEEGRTQKEKEELVIDRVMDDDDTHLDNLKDNVNVLTVEKDSLSGILPNTDSVEISLRDIESRSDTVEMELVSNFSDNATGQTDTEDGLTEGRERERGDGEDSFDTEADESVEIEYTSKH